MGADESDRPASESGSRRRRRRRRRRRGGNESSNEAQNQPTVETNQSRGGRNNWRDESQPLVRLPPTGYVPHARSSTPTHSESSNNSNSRTSGIVRRRRLSRMEMDDLALYLNRLPDEMVASFYKGMGGQPSRVANKERMIQLAVRAIAQGTRLGTLIRSLHQRDRQALAILVQCGGIAHHEEFYQELILSLGGNDREWKKVLATLGDKGLVAASETREGDYFYIVPDPLVAHLVDHLKEDLMLPSFDHEDVRVINPQAFSPPLDFSLVTLSTYIDQHPPRLTQRQEIFKTHKDELDNFFKQLWGEDSDLFNFHIEFLMVHGMVELKGDRLSLNRSVIEEWLQLEQGAQNDLVFSSLEKRFPNAEWVIRVIHDIGGDWVPERPLQALYRRWRRGEDWRKRFHSTEWKTVRHAARESYSFSPLVTTGLLEQGQWGQEKFYRLNPRGERLLQNTPQADGFTQFYLTPSFEIMAPAGMAPILFSRIGDLAELTSCDRANTYKITEVTIEQALEKGWRRDDILEFLRDNSQIGLPENVEQTLRSWMGHHGDVEFHDVMLLTVHRSQIRRIESLRKLKPFLLHRFVPGMYAVDRSRMPELTAALGEADFTPMNKIRKYPGDLAAVDSRKRLLEQVIDARAERGDLLGLAHIADTQPENLHPVPGTTRTSRRRRKRDEMPPRCTPAEVRDSCVRAVTEKANLQMLYVTRDDQRKLLTVVPERLATTPAGKQVLVAADVKSKARLSYQLLQIERIAVVARK